ncbi:MAG: aminopeptidase P family N-terminal domain-containing protein, partial [Geminicoccaceae bacterium]|nr:aminopeptidase P family N-terminal domain-containing protein [Geminicoccaceae bacterium]
MTPGDESTDELERCLRDSGSTYRADEVVALVRAVAAAPQGHDPDAWLDLVAPADAHGLRARLLEMLATVRAEPRDDPPAAERLGRLRAELERSGVTGFLLPLTDEHGSEYLPDAARRLSWLTGFTGSAGFLIVMPQIATLFVDGRYTLQAAAELDPELYERAHITDTPPSGWLAERLEPGQRIGYDPALHRPNELERFEKAAERAGATLVPLGANPVDAVWQDRPPLPVSPVVQLDEAFAGESSEAKRARIGSDVRSAGGDLMVVAAPDAIAWLLNIRGGDVPFNPLSLAYLLLHADGAAELFIDRRKLRPDQHLGNGVSIQPIERFDDALAGQAGRAVLADPSSINARITSRLKQAGARVVEGKDPITPAKARKNAVEIEGARRAQIRDGAAMARFLA